MLALLLARTIVLPLVVGVGALECLGLRFRQERLAFLGWAWAIGAAFAALTTFAWSWCGLGAVSVWVVDAWTLAAGVVLVVAGRRRAHAVVHAPPPPAPTWERRLLLGVLVLVLVVMVARLVLSTAYPVVARDEAGFWSFRAKLIFHNEGFTAGYLADAKDHRLPNEEYPLLNPLLQTWMFAHAGQITHIVNRLPILLFSFATMLVLAGGLRRSCRPALAAVLIAIVAAMRTTRASAGDAQSDVMVAFGALLALDAWLRWHVRADTAWTVLGTLGLSIALAAKLEGMVLCLCLVAALLVTPRETLGSLRRLKTNALLVLVPLGVAAGNWVMNHALEARPAFGRGHGLGPLVTGFLERCVERGGEVLAYFGALFVAPRLGWVLPALVVLVLSRPRAWWRGSLRVPTLAILFGLVATIVVFLLVPSRDVSFHLSVAAERLWYQLALSATLLLGVLLGRSATDPSQDR